MTTLKGPWSEIVVKPLKGPCLQYQNLCLSMSSRISWSTVSKAADRSIATSDVIDCLSILHKMSLLSCKIAVFTGVMLSIC